MTDERKKLDRLYRQIARPAISENRLSLTPNRDVRFQLQTPCRHCTTHFIFEPLDFLARLAALASRPRGDLTRLHGMFAPKSKVRAVVTHSGNKTRMVD
jgi:hypothetical protein